MEIATSVLDVIFTTLLFITLFNLLKDKEFYCFLEQRIIIMTYEKKRCINHEPGILNNFI